MLKVLLEKLSEIVDGLDPDAIPLCEVPNLWKDFARGERLMASAKTLLARRVEEGNTWRGAGYRSAAEQMAVLSGTSVSTEKMSIETSKRVNKLPKTANAMRKGKLSSAKAEAIAGAATVAPAAEANLLDGAEKKPFGELREECLKAKAVDVDKTRERIHRDRCARIYKDAEGAWNIYGRGPVDLGAGFMALWQPTSSSNSPVPKAARNPSRRMRSTRSWSSRPSRVHRPSPWSPSRPLAIRLRRNRWRSRSRSRRPPGISS